MDYDSDERRKRREHRHKVIADRKAGAKAIQAADPSRRMLMREAKRKAMRLIEDSARTDADFEKVILMWDNMKIVAYWRIEKQEETRSDMPTDELTERTTIIPEPLNHVWWRQQLHGNFLDSIHDCPHEVHEFVSCRELYRFIKELDERHKELLYYRAIRRWTPQRLAEYRGQTDRNIRGVYNRLIESLRHEAFEWLYPFYEAGASLTLAYREFCRAYHAKLSETREIEAASDNEITSPADGEHIIYE